MSPRFTTDRMRDAAPAILPSLLLCDFGRLEREVRRLEEAGAAALHLDVMDGVFVPNLTYGMPIVEAFRRLTELPLDVHLMIARPGQYVRQFVDAGADAVSFHIEAVDDPRPVLSEIRELGAAAGIALNPGTLLDTIEPHLGLCDFALVMSVEAGFGGQPFNPVALEKIRRLRQLAGRGLLLEVDGGISEKTIGSCAEAGADLFVVGSAIFKSDDYQAVVQTLTDLAQPVMRM